MQLTGSAQLVWLQMSGRRVLSFDTS